MNRYGPSLMAYCPRSGCKRIADEKNAFTFMDQRNPSQPIVWNISAMMQMKAGIWDRCQRPASSADSTMIANSKMLSIAGASGSSSLPRGRKRSRMRSSSSVKTPISYQPSDQLSGQGRPDIRQIGRAGDEKKQPAQSLRTSPVIKPPSKAPYSETRNRALFEKVTNET